MIQTRILCYRQTDKDSKLQVMNYSLNVVIQVPNQRIELVFLVDSSASVGATNFFNEIKFVKKLLADFAVSYNQTRVALITFSSKTKVCIKVFSGAVAFTNIN